MLCITDLSKNELWVTTSTKVIIYKALIFNLIINKKTTTIEGMHPWLQFGFLFSSVYGNLFSGLYVVQWITVQQKCIS